MDYRKFKIYHFFLALLFFFTLALSKTSFAQQSLTLQYLEPIQNNYTNPAFITDYEWHIGMPCLSSLSFQYGNSGFKYTHLVVTREDDSTYLDLDNFIDVLKKKNNLSVELQEELLSFGMKYDDYYITFSVSDKVSAYWNYPKDFFEFVVKGNGKFLGETANFNDMALKVNHYREYALGAARELNSQWTVGAKVKLLFGKMNISAKNIDASIYTDPTTFDLEITTNVDINTSIPQSLTDSDVDFDLGNYFWNGKNPGLALDLGAIYKYNDEITISGSLLDFGFIRWKSDVKNFKNENVTWTFEGIDVNDYIGENDSTVKAHLESFKDSIADKFMIDESSDKYSEALTSKIYLGGTYTLSDDEIIGLLTRTFIFDGRLHPSITASYNRKLHEMISATASYTVINRNFGNVGLGFVFNWKQLQVYAATDNIFGLFMPDKSKYYNFHFGINFVFEESLTNAVPLIF